jgi:hypothetical protein
MRNHLQEQTLFPKRIHLRTSETTSNSSVGQAGETVIELSVNENKHRKLKQKLQQLKYTFPNS